MGQAMIWLHHPECSKTRCEADLHYWSDWFVKDKVYRIASCMGTPTPQQMSYDVERASGWHLIPGKFLGRAGGLFIRDDERYISEHLRPAFQSSHARYFVLRDAFRVLGVRRVPRDKVVVPGLTHTEYLVSKKFERRGFEVLRNGWPDFLVVKNGMALFIEVKAQGDLIRPEQEAMHKALRSLGLKVRVIRYKNGYLKKIPRNYDRLKEQLSEMNDLSIAEAALRLKISEATVKNWRRDQKQSFVDGWKGSR